MDELDNHLSLLFFPQRNHLLFGGLERRHSIAKLGNDSTKLNGSTVNGGNNMHYMDQNHR